MSEIKTTMPDRLIMDGVCYMGYGLVPKVVMLDKSLSLTAKAIYAYYASLSGNGVTCFPSRETTQVHLGLGNKAYYKHRQMLVDQGYLQITPQTFKNQRFTTNSYTLVSNPKKFSVPQEDQNWISHIHSTIQNQGILQAGYGRIPRSVMFDLRLDYRAKAIYALFASYAGGGKSAFPAVPQIRAYLGISQNVYLKGIRLLQEYDYIRVKQRNSQDGKRGFSVNDYFLIEHPGAAEEETSEEHTETESCVQKDNTVRLSCVQKEHTTSPSHIQKENTGEESHVQKEHTEPPSQVQKAHTEKAKATDAYTENADTTKNTPVTKNNSSTNINLSDYRPPADGWIDTEEDYSFLEPTYSKEECKQLIRSSLDYEMVPVCYPHTNIHMVDNLIDLMATACSCKHYVRIGSDLIKIDDIRSLFFSYEMEWILYVMDSVENTKSEIKNIRAYYLTALYHAPETIDLYYDRKVKQDMESPDWGISL